jgi:hypothetical protein
LSKWFIELKNKPDELERLQKGAIYRDLFEFRKKILQEFQNVTLTLADDEVPDKVGNAFPRAWKFITGELKRNKKVVTQQDMNIFLSSLDYSKLGLAEKTCVNLVVYAEMHDMPKYPATQ